MKKMKCRNTKCRKELMPEWSYCPFCGWSKEPKEKKNKSRRRANGEGSVYLNAKTGLWTAQSPTTYTYVQGSAPVKYRAVKKRKTGFKTKTDAINALKEMCLAAEEPPKELTLKQLYDIWLPTYNGSSNTRRGYVSAFAIFAPVWNMPLNKITVDDLQDCFDEYEPKGHGASTGKHSKHQARTCLSLVYKYAAPRGYITANASGEYNLSKFLDTGEAAHSHKNGFTETDLAKLKANADNVYLADYIYCACYLGFRPSAFLSLKIEDYNSALLSIRGGIKTEAGINRTVTVSPKIKNILSRIIGSRTQGYIFNKNDKQYPLDTFRDDFYICLKKCGIENTVYENGKHKYTPHSCRHTFATLLKNINAPAKDKLELMGHTSEEMLSYYQDVNIDDLKRITDKL